ncbi:hypothetical protein Taro_001781, partial [Colocasia esculenta]|nr:hypothetical protein [Colocasia esculenta]
MVEKRWRRTQKLTQAFLDVALLMHDLLNIKHFELAQQHLNKSSRKYYGLLFGLHFYRHEIDGKLVAAKILSWRQHRVPLTHLDGKDLAAKFFCSSQKYVEHVYIMISDFWMTVHAVKFMFGQAMASRGRHGAQAREDEQRCEERGDQQAPTPQGPTVLPPPPPVDYGVFIQGLVQAMQTQSQTQATLQAQLQAQAQALAPVPQEHGHGGSSIMERFKRMAPPSFKGESQPLLAESWMREVEKIFRAIRCAEEDKVSLATYMLQAGERDGPVSGREEGSTEEVRATFPEVGQEEGRVPVITVSSGIESVDSYTAVPQLQAQRQEGYAAWSASPSNSSSGSASDRETRKASSPSSSFGLHFYRQEIDGKLVAAKILSWRQHRVPLTHLDGKDLAAKFFCSSQKYVEHVYIMISDFYMTVHAVKFMFGQ